MLENSAVAAAPTHPYRRSSGVRALRYTPGRVRGRRSRPGKESAAGGETWHGDTRHGAGGTVARQKKESGDGGGSVEGRGSGRGKSEQRRLKVK